MRWPSLSIRSTVLLGIAIAVLAPTVALYAFLKRIGCGVLQGYLIGRPVPAETFAAQALTTEVQPGDAASLHALAH